MVDLNAKELFEKGIKYFSENKLLLAEKNFENALKLAPDRISILENLATVYYLNEKFEDSENILNKSIKLQNNSLKISNLMIKVLQKQGKIKELKSYIAKELSKKKLDLKYNIIKNFSYPIFFENEEEIKLARSEFENSLDELEKIKDLKLKIDSDLIEPPIFYISYDRYENLNINKKIVNLYRKFYPELNQNFVVKKKEIK